MNKLGLIGYPLSHSFSKKYFTDKFASAQISNYEYELYALGSINVLPELWKKFPNLIGLNVTIPYKQVVKPYLKDLVGDAAAIQTTNVLKRVGADWFGYNSDVYGFQRSLLEFVNGASIDGALILGTGGAAKAVAFVMSTLGISYQYVSRKTYTAHLNYTDLNEHQIETHNLIINCTPLGTFPQVDSSPNIPYHLLTENHFVKDLVYNPAETLFMQRAKKYGAQVKNGLDMLVYQAEKSWEIWTS